jgi:outer membrane protein
MRRILLFLAAMLFAVSPAPPSTAAAAASVSAPPAAAASAPPAESLSAPTVVTGPPPHPITLEEAVAMARRNALEVIQAEGQRRISDAEVRSAYAAFLPSVSISAGATRQLPSEGNHTRIQDGQVITVPTDPWSSSVSLGASVVLFDGGRRIFDLKQARVRQVSAGIGAESQQYTTTLAVKQQFFDVLAARESEAAALTQLAQAQQQQRAANARVRARNATRSDSLRAAIQVRSAEQSVRDARDAAEVAGAVLTRLVGSSDPVTAATDDSLSPGDLAAGEAELRAWAERGPAVRQAEQSLAAAQAARSGAWAAYLPTVSASYSRGGSGTSSGLGLSGTDFSYSGSMRLSLSLPIFNQLQREGQSTQAEVALQNARAVLRDAPLSAREEITRLLVAFRSARDRVVSQELNVETAQEDLRVQELRYGEGSSTLLDLLTSQTQLDQARRDLIRARYDRRVAKAQLEALVGRDL